jgi:hypothetical protein
LKRGEVPGPKNSCGVARTKVSKRKVSLGVLVKTVEGYGTGWPAVHGHLHREKLAPENTNIKGAV